MFTVAPTRTSAGISLIFNYLINEIAKYVTSHSIGGHRNVTSRDKDGGGVNNS